MTRLNECLFLYMIKNRLEPTTADISLENLLVERKFLHSIFDCRGNRIRDQEANSQKSGHRYLDLLTIENSNSIQIPSWNRNLRRAS